MNKIKLLYEIIILGAYILSNVCNAQTSNFLTYDANGNRIKKEIKGSSPHPIITANPEAVNPGQASTLSASGCSGTVQWLPVNLTGNQITVTPSVTTQYTAQCVVGGCANNGFSKVTVGIISCPSVPLTVVSSANAVRYGQNVNLFAFGCTSGFVEWSSGNIGSPTNITIYGSSQVFTATCKTKYCPNLGSGYVIIGGISGCQTGDVMTTKQDGSWNNPATWACNRLPTSSDVVYINHQLTLYGNATSGAFGYAKAIIKGNAGGLTFDNRSTIFIPQN